MDVQVVGGIKTHVFSLKNNGAGNRSVPLMLIIPGTPGICHLYVPFAKRLFHLGQGRFDVSVISHAGHSPGHYKDTTSHSSVQASSGSISQDLLSEVTDWYTLLDQVEHKLAFIQQQTADRDSLILIGHSLGCWIVLKMLQHLTPSRVEKAILLFPAIERISFTPRARSFTSYFWSSLQTPFLGLVWLYSKLTPSFVKTYMWSYYFYTTPPEHLEFIMEGMKQVDERCMYNLLQVAKHEMDRVKDPPLDVIDANIDKIVFYYGVDDQWNVEDCYRDMASRYPGKEVHLCPPNFSHAFVEHVSDEMASFVHSKLCN